MDTRFFYSYKKLWIGLIILLGCFFNSPIADAQFYYGSQTDFGKNRMKYEDFFWTYYAYEHYDVYFYEEGKELANYVSQSVKKELSSIEQLFDYSLDGRLQFMIYNKQSDFQQSNLGLSTIEQFNIGGFTRVVGSKIILYYEGDHAKLDAQIRAGIAQVLIDQMMYGGGLRETVKNNTLLSLPDWYVKGLISYVANDWNSDIDNRMKDAIFTGKYRNINHLEGDDAVNAGHALWKHIATNYGEVVIPNILYMTKVSRNIDNSSTFVLGISMGNLWDECLGSFANKYYDKDKTKSLPTQPPVVTKPKSKRVYSQLKVSPNGNYAVYTTNEKGQYKIWLRDLKENKPSRILKSGQKLDRVNDYSYPLLAWHPSGKVFSYITESKGYLVLTTYELETQSTTQRNITGFEKILDYSYSDDGKTFVMSAVQKGQTDIFIFTAASSAYYQVTKDIYDDLTPRFAHGSKEIVFASNRPIDTLFFDPKHKYEEAQRHKDVFVFNNKTKSRALIRVTNTPAIDESYPTDYDSTHISYLSDLNGIRNRYLASFDSAIAFVDTATHYRTVVSSFPISNYSRSILEQDVNVKAHQFSEIIYERGKYEMYISPLASAATLTPFNLINTSYRDYRNKIEKKGQMDIEEKNKSILTPQIQTVKVITSTIEPPPKKDSTDIDINNYTFENEQKKPEKIIQQPVDNNDTASSPSITKRNNNSQFGKQRNYNTNFYVNYVITQLDNSFYNDSYQKFLGGAGYVNPGLSVYLKTGIIDLFEDYRITGGMRIATDLSNNEYYLSIEDLMKKLDGQLILHRQALLSVPDNNSLTNIYSQDARYNVKLPINEVSSLRGSIGYQNIRTVYLANSDSSLHKSDQFQNWGSVTAQYVFDNTLNKGLNLYNGLRAKFFGQYNRQVDKVNADFYVVGCDVRYYLKIHRELIWANRFSASSSFGHEKLLYYLGGVDSWIGAQFNNTTDVNTNQNYAFQTLATPLRGFLQNARNGNNFAVINSELRLPVFKYFSVAPLRSDFLQNFQVIAFTDIGTAWSGHYSESNTVSTNTIGTVQTPLIVTITTQHNPILGGYGLGLRSRIFGYFVRLDRAWGVEDGIIQKAVTYVSLCLDF